MSAYDLTTEEGIQEFLLQKHGEAPKSVKLLTGGTANYVYSVTFKDGSVKVYKHAAPYLHSNMTFAFDPARMDYEARILDRVGTMQDSAGKVHAVELFDYDSETKLLCMGDGGPANLKTVYYEEWLNIPEVANHLATWLSSLHTRSINTYLAEDPNGKGNNPIAVAIYRHSYANLHTALAKFGDDTTLADRINEQFGSLLATENECICHGDFWPGNVLVRQTTTSAPTTPSMNPFSDVDLTIVDWELTRRGTSATDVGQFAAEAYLLDRFRGGRGLRAAFLSNYLEKRTQDIGTVQIGREWLLRMAVHWAVHVAFWPTRVEWTNEEGTRGLVKTGVEVLEAVLRGKWLDVSASVLFDGVREEWKWIFERP